LLSFPLGKVPVVANLSAASIVVSTKLTLSAHTAAWPLRFVSPQKETEATNVVAGADKRDAR